MLVREAIATSGGWWGARNAAGDAKGAGMAREHVIDPSVVHHQWDADLEPLLTIDSGDTVHFDIKVAGEGQVWPGATYGNTRFDFDTIYNLSGPVWVNGAEPGDTLQVDVLDLVHGDWGWAAFLPELGLL